MVKKNPLVTVIIPFLNSESYIKETLDSVINQTWDNLEVILVNNGSEDGTLNIVSGYLSDRILLINNFNRGASIARNAALKLSRGTYIQFLDSDDILANNKIESQVTALISESPGAVASGPFRNFIGNIGNAPEISADNGYKSIENPIDWLIDASWGRAMFPPVAWLTPKEIIEKAGPWNETLTYNDDSEFFARVLLKSKKIVFRSDAVSYYRRGNANSLGSQSNYSARKSEFESLCLVAGHMLNHENSYRVKEACSYAFSKLYYSLYPEYKEFRKEIDSRINDLGCAMKSGFGHGFTSNLGKLIGWKNAKWLRFQLKNITRHLKA
jgi:glycosyltransferase involved in cell wall biosynthesis